MPNALAASRNIVEAPSARRLSPHNGPKMLSNGHAKKTALLSDSSDESDNSDSDGGVPLKNGSDEAGFKINEEYAKRFEHNKKREELHRLEEKHGSAVSKKRKRGVISHGGAEGVGEGTDSHSSSESSSSEDEDDIAELVTEDVDQEISAALQAIKSKDPRVYDKSTVFFSEFKNDEDGAGNDKKQKPMYLRDYHRHQLLNGASTDEKDSEPTFVEEQQRLQRSIIQEMHQGAEEQNDSDEEGDDDDFLIRKSKDESQSHRRAKRNIELDPKNAEKDPESFLSNFMASRAWIPTTTSRFQPFESDDEEEEARADAFEAAYNLRFEDPKTSNEKLTSHARDVAAEYSVRRKEVTGRRKVRDVEREKRELEKQERGTERARLRKLRIEETEARLQKVKEAAGLRGRDIGELDWSTFLEANWDNEQWESEMNNLFGDDYYDAPDGSTDDEGRMSRKAKKPKWEDDIDIQDLVPDFDGDTAGQPQYRLSSDEDGEGDDAEDSHVGVTKKERSQARRDQKRESRKQQRKIEQMVDENMDLDLSIPNNSKSGGRFQYRETSPTTFGLSAADILLASDSQLNEFAGLKKLATFRPDEKKQKDKKRLSKKARLRQWRRDTFGDDRGPDLSNLGNGNDTQMATGATEETEPSKGKKKRRRKAKKAKTE